MRFQCKFGVCATAFMAFGHGCDYRRLASKPKRDCGYRKGASRRRRQVVDN
jgi:hypothetical protein